MINGTKPAKPEISDIANAVLDGADGIVLSKETSIGEHPVEAIKTLCSVCVEAEAAVYSKQLLWDLTKDKLTSPIETMHAIAISVVDTAFKCCAAAIIVLTRSGRSARLVAKYKPRCPIIAVTRRGHISRKLRLYRGLVPFHYIGRVIRTLL